MSESEQNRANPGVWLAIFIIFLLLTPRFWLCFIPGTFNHRTLFKSYHPLLQKNCAANIQIINGAIEKYNMEKNEMLDEINSELDLQRLWDLGYLKHMPRCAKFYEDDHPNLSKWLGWGRSVVVVPECYEGHNLSRDGKLRCKLHGEIPD